MNNGNKENVSPHDEYFEFIASKDKNKDYLDTIYFDRKKKYFDKKNVKVYKQSFKQIQNGR